MEVLNITNEDNNDKDDESEGFLDKIENAASKAVDFVEDVMACNPLTFRPTFVVLRIYS